MEMSFVSKWSLKYHTERLSKYKQEVIRKENFLKNYIDISFPTTYVDDIMNLKYGYEHPIGDDFPSTNILWNENILYGYKQLSYYKYIQCDVKSTPAEKLKKISVKRNHFSSIEMLNVFSAKEISETNPKEIQCDIKSTPVEELKKIPVKSNPFPSIEKLNVFSAKDISETNPKGKLKYIQSWFPLWIDGVCKIVCQINNSSNQSFKTVITGAVLSYSQLDQLFTTIDCNYKLIGGIDTNFMGKHLKFFQDKPVEVLGNFDDDNWLKYAVKLSFKIWNGFIGYTRNSIIRKRKPQRRQLLLKILCQAQWKKQLKISGKIDFTDDYLSICEELEIIARTIEGNGDWLPMFQAFLRQYGQSADVIEKLVNIDPQNSIIRPVDLDISQESISYENFTDGEKFNSTFTNLDGKLAFWSVTKNPIGQFCIAGLKLTNCRERFIEIDPVAIGSVMSSGRAVIADHCCYELLGPMYPLSVWLGVPDAANTEYLWPILSYFTNGLPTHWRYFAFVMDTLFRCLTLSKRHESIPIPITISPDRSKRDSRSCSLHSVSVIDSNTITSLAVPLLKLDKHPIVLETTTNKADDSFSRQVPTVPSIMDISFKRPSSCSSQQPAHLTVAMDNAIIKKRKAESSQSIETPDKLPLKRKKIQNKKTGRKKSKEKQQKKCSFAMPLIVINKSDECHSVAVSKSEITKQHKSRKIASSIVANNKQKSNDKSKNDKNNRTGLFEIDLCLTKNKFNSFEYIEYLSHNEVVQITRSGRRSLPPLDPRFDVEYKIENEKVFLQSNNEKIELVNRISHSQKK